MGEESKLLEIYEKLLAHYGAPHWWPAQTPYEVIVGAVLTQNTAWTNVAHALANFGGSLCPEFVASADIGHLKNLVRPAGFFNQKAAYLKAVTAWFAKYNYSADEARRRPLAAIRPELLAVKGVGEETADSILLYACGFPTFVIDAYTRRLCGAVKRRFEQELPADAVLFNNYHALIVINAKEHCRKKPLCAGCPLEESCAKRI